jgi:hypothetical protein
MRQTEAHNMLARVDVGIAVVAGAVVILQTVAGEFSLLLKI